MFIWYVVNKNWQFISSSFLMLRILSQLERKEDWYLLSFLSARGFGIVTPLSCSGCDCTGLHHLWVNASSFREFEGRVPLFGFRFLGETALSCYRRSQSTYCKTNNYHNMGFFSALHVKWWLFGSFCSAFP